MKWINFYHKDLESNLVGMIGMDSVMPIDGRLNLSSIRTKVQERVKKMENIKGFDPCAFSILTGGSLWMLPKVSCMLCEAKRVVR